MAKFYTLDGDEVEAFTQAEVDVKLAEVNKVAEDKQKALDAKTTEFDKLNERYEDKNKSYSELLKKSKDFEEAEKDRQEKTESDYKKSVDEQVKKIAGDDKEYAKALREQLEREGIKEVTTDTVKIERQIKEAKALTDIAMAREPQNTPIDGGGEGPGFNPDGKDFTETAQGKSTFDALAGMMGLPAEEIK